MLAECLCVTSSTSQYLKDKVRPPLFTHVSSPPSVPEVFSSFSLSRVVGSPARDDNYCHVPSCYWNLSHTHTLCWHHHRWCLCPQPVSWSQPVTHMFVCLRRICQVGHANRFFCVRQILCRFSVTQVCFMRRSLLGKHTHPIFKKNIYFYSDILQAEKSWNCSAAHQSAATVVTEIQNM